MLDLRRTDAAAHRIHSGLEPQPHPLAIRRADQHQLAQGWSAVPLPGATLFVRVVPDQLLSSHEALNGLQPAGMGLLLQLKVETPNGTGDVLREALAIHRHLVR